jgi:Mn-dependent DtxR family transcriptional regulator
MCEMVLELMKTEADMDGLVTITASYMGEKLGVSSESAERATHKLVADGVVEHVGYTGHGGVTMIQLQDY